MEKLILGFDLCDDVTKISRYRLDNMNPADISFPQADNRTVIQTALGRKKGQDGWLVGKEAYEAVLEGGGAVVDKLLTLLTKKNSVAVGDRRYQPEQLLGSYIGTLLETVYEQCGTRSVADLSLRLKRLIRQLWTVLSIVWTALEYQEKMSASSITQRLICILCCVSQRRILIIEPCF